MDQNGNPNMPWYFPSDKYEKDYLQMIRYAIENEEPFSLVRVGDGELYILAQESLFPLDYIRTNVPWASGYGYCGVVLPDLEIKVRMVNAIKNATVVGLFEGDPLSEAVWDSLGYKPVRNIYAFDNVFLPMNRDFVQLVREFPPLLVGREAPRYKEYIEGQLNVTLPPTVNLEDSRGIDQCIQEMLSIPHKWSLVSGGANAVIICSELAYKYKKVSFDAGHMWDNVMAPDYKEYWLKVD